MPGSDPPASESAPQTPSVHRAFMYSAAIPGWGQWYAGQRSVGGIDYALLAILLLGFFVTLISVVNSLVGRLFGAFDGVPVAPVDPLAVLSLGAVVLGIYLLWLWGMGAAVDASVRRRAHLQLPQQRSLPWSVFMAWLCPGAGQLYLGARGLGYGLLAVTALMQLLVIPAYRSMLQDAMALVQDAKVSAANVEVLIDAVHALQLRVDYSAGTVLSQVTSLLAIALTVAALRQPFAAAPVSTHAMGLLALGWLCPGAAQLQQQRIAVGAALLATYLVSLLVVAALFGLGVISPATLGRLEWWLFLLRWGAMLEAVLRLAHEPR